YFYLPGYGAYGTDEWEEYNDYMQIADDQIEENKTSGGNENIQDVVGGMFSGNTETFITVTYQDGDGTIDLVLPVLDEDNMVSNLDTVLATQQSIKAYADALHALQYLKTEIDELSELEAIWSKDVTDSSELATALAGLTGADLSILDSVYTVDDGFDAGLRNGVYSGLTVTDSAELTIYWSEGVAYVDGSIFAVNADTSETIANNATTYLYVLEDNATMQESTTEPTVALLGKEFALVCILSTYANDIHEKFDFPLMSGTLRYDMWKFLDAITPTACVGGCNTTIDTDDTLANDFKVATGSYYTDVLDLNTIDSMEYSSTSDHDANNLTAYFHVSEDWTDSPENGVNFSYWDNKTQKTGTAANKWYTGWIYVEDGDTLIYVYPQSEHASEGDALDEAAQFPPYHEGVILPSAKFIFRHGESAFGARAYFVDIRPFFGYGNGGPFAQMIYQTVTGDSGTTTATASDDEIEIVGGGIVETEVTADTVTVTAT
ncbi:unnamed protein product, partial [marine sediment metagenome]